MLVLLPYNGVLLVDPWSNHADVRFFSFRVPNLSVVFLKYVDKAAAELWIEVQIEQMSFVLLLLQNLGEDVSGCALLFALLLCGLCLLGCFLFIVLHVRLHLFHPLLLHAFALWSLLARLLPFHCSSCSPSSLPSTASSCFCSVVFACSAASFSLFFMFAFISSIHCFFMLLLCGLCLLGCFLFIVLHVRLHLFHPLLLHAFALWSLLARLLPFHCSSCSPSSLPSTAS